jgi:hypothetical protein
MKKAPERYGDSLEALCWSFFGNLLNHGMILFVKVGMGMGNYRLKKYYTIVILSN